MSLTFLVPFCLIYVFGSVFGVNRKDSGPSDIPLAVVNASANPAAAKLVAALQAEKTFHVITNFVNPDKSTRPLTEDDLRPKMKANEFHIALVLPPDLLREDALGLHLKILTDPRNEMETQMVMGILQKTLFSNVPQLLGQSLQTRARGLVGSPRMDSFNAAIADNVARTFGGDRDQILANVQNGSFGFDQLGGGNGAGGTAGGSSDLFSKIVRIDQEQVVGQDVKSPMATRLVGGWAIQFLLFAVTASATALFYERDLGLFHRLLAGPVTRAHILWSKFIYGVILGLIQLVVLFGAGRFFFGIDVEQHLGLLVLTCTIAAAACTAFGMLLASIASSPEAAQGMATLLIMLMCCLGGAWFPLEMIPLTLRHFSKLTLVYWAQEGFSQVLWANASFFELLPTLGILAAMTAGVMAIAVWRFNRGKIFG